MTGHVIKYPLIMLVGGDKDEENQNLTEKTMKSTVVKGGCGECQTSCQSACKTSCTVGNQSCENN